MGLGFAILLLGADWLVKGASSLAKRFNVSEIVIGLSVVAFGTSAPELTVSILSAIKGSSDIVFGNVIGSNNLNVLVILGVTALFYPLAVKKDTVKKEIPFAFFVSLLTLILVNDAVFMPNSINILSRLDSVILLICFGAFLVYIFRLGKKTELAQPQIAKYSLPITIGAIVLGMAGLVWGGNIVVKQAIIIARSFSISERVIGLTIVAFGTSLPEFATSLVAAIKKHHDIAVGNIVGSNIFNLLLIMGVSGLISPALYKSSFNIDFLVVLGSTLMLFLFLFASKHPKLLRWHGAVLLTAYIVYSFYAYH
jgi:cation:H+ antiporter